MIKQLEGPPTSGQYEEIIFDLDDSWRGQNWHYVLFTKTDGQEWCGHFREKENGNFLTDELTEINIACIVSGGHGYIIDIEKKERIKDLDNDQIISLASDEITSSFLVATYYDIQRIDRNYNVTEINLPIEVDGIHFLDKKERRIPLDIDEIGAELNTNKEFYLDLNDWTIKKH